MDFKNFLSETAVKVNQSLEDYLKLWQIEVDSSTPQLNHLISEFILSCQGGKRLRGALVKLGFLLTESPDTENIIKAAVGVEIFQTAILSHDDIIDLSPTRRGGPTIYYKLGANHYATSQTICLGDIGFFMAMKCITESNFDANLKNKAANELSKMFINTGLGQMLDIELPYQNNPKTEADVLTIHKYKTAFYTIVYPMVIGAIFGGGSEKLLDSLRIFGENLGIAYQIQDDILGVFGDEKKLGKSISSDVKEDKNTLLIVQALKKGNREQLEILNKYYGKKDITTDQLDQIREVFIKTGSLVYSQNLSLEYVKKAKLIIPQISKNKYHLSLLNELADFLIYRDK